MIAGLLVMIGAGNLPVVAETAWHNSRHHGESHIRSRVTNATPKLHALFPELNHVTLNLSTLSEVALVMNATDWTPERKREAAKAGQAILVMPVRMVFPDTGSSVYVPNGNGDRTQYFPNPEIFAKAIGKTHISREGQALFDALGITEADFQKHPKGVAELRIWGDMNQGVQLGFEDVGAREAYIHYSIGKGPWLITEVIFWNIPASGQPYAGAKPFGIQFDMTRQEVRERVTVEMTVEDAAADVWDLGDLELVVNYIEDTQSIRCVSYNVPQEID
ncbi:hypothetical protein SAMN05421772_10396 [Paracoccus saliphilus]|nr:hypothetical protein SAMN05421772_10396 [Paracoccus saliphilus]